MSEDTKELIFWCANLGTTSFLIRELHIEEAFSGNDGAILKKAPPIVPVGKIVEISLADETHKLYGRHNWNLTVKLKGPLGELRPASKAYFVLFSNGQVANFHESFDGFEPLTCPKCENTVFKFSIDGITSKEYLQKELAIAKHDLTASCPNHVFNPARLTPVPNQQHDIATEGD